MNEINNVFGNDVLINTVDNVITNTDYYNLFNNIYHIVSVLVLLIFVIFLFNYLRCTFRSPNK